MTERECYIALNLMEGVGPVRVRNLMQHFGAIEPIFSADVAEFYQVPGLGPKIAASLVDQRGRLDPVGEIARAEDLGFRIITPLDECYPAALREIHDPPLALYVMGTLIPEKDRHGIAVIGSRRCSHYGKQVADRLSYQLANTGFTVISGLARGIDEAAHTGAVKSQGRTIAVLGSGLDEIYPAENAALAEQIAKKGAVISEFPLGIKPSRTTFPMRNRIVSGMCSGVLVVEAGTSSGAMITVNEAQDQGRAIFAVPGRVDNPGARGCHRLIKDGAILVETVDDVLEYFEFLIRPDGAEAKPEPVMSPDEENIRAALSEGELIIDELARKTEIPIARINSLLIGLELKRVVKAMPGRMVRLIN
jgi:DNA processing protein